jgi:ferredoxin-type protein NapG
MSLSDRKPPVSRRQLFSASAGLFGELLGEFVGAAEETRSLMQEERRDHILDPSRGLLRPPGAIPESAFRRLCDKCDDCIKACPEDVLFRAPAAFGDDEGSPMFDPARKACFLCSEFHCIAACGDKGALVMPTSVTRLAMGKARIDPARCVAHEGVSCEACVRSCPLPTPAIALLGSFPLIKALECVGCGMCEAACRRDTGRNAIVTLPRLA